MNYTIYTPANAPEASRNTLQALEEKIGFIPNILGMMAISPTALNSVASINMALEQSALTPVERRVVTLTVSTENACNYCVPAQSAMAQMEQMPEETLTALREQDNLDDVKLTNTVIASPDIVAADSYAATLFGLTGADIPYIKAGAKMGLGIMDLNSLKIEEINI